jgi:recombination protein RecT
MATATAEPQTELRQTRPGRQDKEALKASNLKTLREMFAKLSAQLQAALPRFITAERMIRVATTTAQRVPRLLECDPVTLVGAVMQSAQLGLEPDNITGSAYLVPFWNSKNSRFECNLIPGYRGLMMLARRSKDISAFDARVVKAGDLFDFEYGSSQFLRHKPALAMALKDGKFQLPENAKEPETIAAYMIAFYNGARTATGTSPFQFQVLLRPELEKAKQFTKSRDRQGEITGPWVEHPDAMFTKTVIRRGAKLLPFSVELLTAVGLEERAIAGRSQNLGALVADDLGMSFTPADDEGEGSTDGEGDAGIDAELVKRLDEGFAKLGYPEARRTVKMQEFRGRLPELLQWLEAEVLRNAKTAGEGSTAAAGDTKASAPDAATSQPTTQKASTPPPARSSKFRV